MQEGRSSETDCTGNPGPVVLAENGGSVRGSGRDAGKRSAKGIGKKELEIESSRAITSGRFFACVKSRVDTIVREYV